MGRELLPSLEKGPPQTIANLARLQQAQGHVTEALEYGRQVLELLEPTEDEMAKETARALVAELGEQIKEKS